MMLLGVLAPVSALLADTVVRDELEQPCQTAFFERHVHGGILEGTIKPLRHGKRRKVAVMSSAWIASRSSFGRSDTA